MTFRCAKSEARDPDIGINIANLVKNKGGIQVTSSM